MSSSRVAFCLTFSNGAKLEGEIDLEDDDEYGLEQIFTAWITKHLSEFLFRWKRCSAAGGPVDDVRCCIIHDETGILVEDAFQFWTEPQQKIAFHESDLASELLDEAVEHTFKTIKKARK